MNSAKRKFIIDTDAGIDDAEAILMALNAPDVDIVSITTVQGNTNAPQVGKNVLRILKLTGRLDIPVFEGCDHTILGKKIMSPAAILVHGIDGLGGVPDPDPADVKLIQQEHAAQALIRLSKEHEGEITLVAIGPLTNIATVLKLDPGFGSRLKECFIMGGNYYGRGNVTMSAEFNFHCDPEAASIVLEQLHCPTTLIGWEACDDFVFPWAWNKEIATGMYKILNFMAEVIHVKEHSTPEKPDVYIEIADEFVMAAAIDRSVILESTNVYATVELNGEITRGQMVVDWKGLSKKDANLTIILKPDKAAVRAMLSNALLK